MLKREWSVWNAKKDGVMGGDVAAKGVILGRRKRRQEQTD